MNQADTAWMLISTALVLLRGIQAVAVLAAAMYSGVVSYVILKLVGAVLPLRADAGDESEGLDVTQHGEEAYIHAEGATALRMATSESVGAGHGLVESYSQAR